MCTGRRNAIKECHCQDPGRTERSRTERIFLTKNVFKSGFQAAQYLADPMEMWFILLVLVLPWRHSANKPYDNKPVCLNCHFDMHANLAKNYLPITELAKSIA